MTQSRMIRLIFINVFLLAVAQQNAHLQTTSKEIFVEIRSTLQNLLDDEDTDGDQKITMNDFRIKGTERGDKRFLFMSIDHCRYEVAGVYYLSNLLQELQLLREAGFDTSGIRFDRIYEQPIDRISRNISELYWNGLTRQIDEKGLLSIIRDEKTATIDSVRYLYVPSSDNLAVNYFNNISRTHPEWNLQVIQLPERITPSYIKNLDQRPGILSLALTQHKDSTISGIPFVVPGGRFNEMYGWDSYFIVLGLLHDGKISLAKSIVENFVYEITYYGAILNANRTYYLTRSQPPFLTSMGLACAEHITDDSTRHAWLQIWYWTRQF